MISFPKDFGVGFAAALYLGIFGTSISLVASSYDCRAKYSELRNLESERWSLQENHSRLLLEYSTWASYDRVDKIARQKLLMKSPALESVVLVFK